MAVQDLLSQDEIDALLHGVDDGLVQTEMAAEPAWWWNSRSAPAMFQAARK